MDFIYVGNVTNFFTAPLHAQVPGSTAWDKAIELAVFCALAGMLI